MSHNTYNSDMPDIKEIQASDEETADFATLCNICCFDEPMTVHEALNSNESHYWQEAMNEEELWCYQGTWVVVDHTPDMHLLTSRWVFKRKRDNSGGITRYRTRLVVRGFAQIPGLDYGDIFAPAV